MSSIFFKSFDELIKENEFNFTKQARNSDKYFAHSLKSEFSDREYETLADHLEKTKKVFLELVELHGIEMVVDKHIYAMTNHVKEIDNKQTFYEFLKMLFFESIHLHDLGKINPNFQVEKMKQDANFVKEINSLGSTHSILSVYLSYSLMLRHIYDLGSDTEKGFAFVILLLFTLPIRKHHSSELTNPFRYFEVQNDEKFSDFFSGIDLLKISKYLDELNLILNEQFHIDVFKGLRLSECFRTPFTEIFLKQIDSFSLFSLIKLNSSLLTISDYLATSNYMWNQDIKVSGIIDSKMRKKIYTSFFRSKEYNSNLIECHPQEFSLLKERSNENLNQLRFKMAYELRIKLIENKDRNLFFLEAPTGGGKTNMSFMAVAELLKMRTELNKVFYVFPFTTLATQTSSAIKETYDLENTEFIELHSKSGFKEFEQEDGKYGNEKQNFVDYQFINYPITLLTHVKFFDIVKSNKKSDNYLYHKLANSIVIIDELQAYSPAHWDKIYYFMKNLSEFFNTVFIVMSATLPKIDQLKIYDDKKQNVRIDFSNYVRLIPDKERYFLNANFAQRVEFDLSLLDVEQISLVDLKERVFSESEDYAEKHQGKCWTLIEFIFKKAASDFFDCIQEDAKDNGFEVKMLSGTILEPVRRKIIKELKNKDHLQEKSKIILISTQVVEAGVDLDFDLGFKDTSIIDSDEQLAGRINRNAGKEDCKVFLFNYNQEYRIYGNDYRYKMQSQKQDIVKYKNILITKDFDSFYKETFQYIDMLNNSESRYGFHDYEDNLRYLNYHGIQNDFKLIDQETISVFVNVEYDLNDFEIKLSQNLRDKLIIGSDNVLKGKVVFELYCNIIENKEPDFTEKKIELVDIQCLMSNFIFSTFNSAQIIEKLKFFADEKYGFWYIDNLKNSSKELIFSLKSGLNEKAMDDVQFI